MNGFFPKCRIWRWITFDSSSICRENIFCRLYRSRRDRFHYFQSTHRNYLDNIRNGGISSFSYWHNFDDKIKNNGLYLIQFNKVLCTKKKKKNSDHFGWNRRIPALECIAEQRPKILFCKNDSGSFDRRNVLLKFFTFHSSSLWMLEYTRFSLRSFSGCSTSTSLYVMRFCPNAIFIVIICRFVLIFAWLCVSRVSTLNHHKIKTMNVPLPPKMLQFVYKPRFHHTHFVRSLSLKFGASKSTKIG